MTDLKRTLSLPLLTFYGLGNILGAGIYVLIGEIAAVAGLYAPLAFLVAALVAAFTAFSYAELSARFPLSAGEAVYLQRGFGRRGLSVTVGLLVALAGMVSVATMANGFVGYLQAFVDVPKPVAVVLLLGVLGGLAAWGIKESVRVAALLTLVEIGGLLLVIWAAWGSFGEIPARLHDLTPPLTVAAWQGIMSGAFLAFFAFIGFEDMVNVAEEVETPQQTMPTAILLALAVASVLYGGVALAAVLTVAPSALAASGAPLAAVYEAATGRAPVVVGMVSLLAVINGALIQIIMASRIGYGMSRQGWLPGWLGKVHPLRRTPLAATGTVTLVVIMLAVFFPLVGLASATSFLILVVFTLVNLALWRVKRGGAAPLGVRLYPSWVPVAGAVTCLVLAGLEVLALLPG